MAAYYNENDPYAVAWLRELIARGLIAPGDVDDRSIKDVQPEDVRGYAQCHFFAGIAGWSYALRLAGWDDDRPIWTGSCPCQPFSVAGGQLGFGDPRHLWPEFRRLIAKCDPATILGEQVAGASQWLRLVRSDLEEMGYAVGCIPIEAASAGADHFRDRYWFVADAASRRAQSVQQCRQIYGIEQPRAENHHRTVADRHRIGSQEPQRVASDVGSQCTPTAGSPVRALVDDPLVGWGEGWTEHEFRSRGFTAAVASIDDRQYVECPDGKWRRFPPPRVRWLGNGVPSRVARLRAIGNAIDPRPATAFIKSYMETIE